MKKIIIATTLLCALSTQAQSFSCEDVRAAYRQYCAHGSVASCIRWALGQGYSWADIQKARACLRRR